MTEQMRFMSVQELFAHSPRFVVSHQARVRQQEILGPFLFFPLPFLHLLSQVHIDSQARVKVVIITGNTRAESGWRMWHSALISHCGVI